MLKTTASKFENCVRFNWGYHDAAQTVREGWDTAERNFGFARGTLVICSASDVLTQHFDSSYARGWLAGYCDAKAALYGSAMPVDTSTSENAWNDCLTAGLVSA